MRNKNGIEKKCENCRHNEASFSSYFFAPCMRCGLRRKKFKPRAKAYEARIAELEEELSILQESERVEVREADRLRAELNETVKLLESKSRECEELHFKLEGKSMLKGELKGARSET